MANAAAPEALGLLEREVVGRRRGDGRRRRRRGGPRRSLASFLTEDLRLEKRPIAPPVRARPWCSRRCGPPIRNRDAATPPHISMVAQFRPERSRATLPPPPPQLPRTSRAAPQRRLRRRRRRPRRAPRRPRSRGAPQGGARQGAAGRGRPPPGRRADLVRSPNVFRGFSPSGEQLERLPLLTRDEELTLVRAAWFFTAAADARRDLEADASVGAARPTTSTSSRRCTTATRRRAARRRRWRRCCRR